MSIEAVGIVAVIVTAFFVAVQAVAVSLQAWYIRGGLKQMREASRQRDKQLEQQDRRLEQQAADRDRLFEQQAADRDRLFEQQAAESERRHQESMRALEALIERTAPPPLGRATG